MTSKGWGERVTRCLLFFSDLTSEVRENVRDQPSIEIHVHMLQGEWKISDRVSSIHQNEGLWSKDISAQRCYQLHRDAKCCIACNVILWVRKRDSTGDRSHIKCTCSITHISRTRIPKPLSFKHRNTHKHVHMYVHPCIF